MSNNRAWMPLHIENYLADTGHLTAAEHGAYMLLIMAYWRDGALPADERLIQRMSRLSKDEWAESRDILAALFQEGWTHKRIDAELAKADEIIEKRRSAATAMHKRKAASASAEHVQSKSSDTRVPPITTEPSSSSLRSEDAPPIAPQGGGAGDLFEDLLGIYPVSPNAKRDRAFKAFSRRPTSEQHDIIAAARKYRAWFDADCIRRGRSPEEAAGFVPPLDGWIINGTWKSVSGLSEAPKVEPMVKLNRVSDEALWLACERVQGKKAPTSDSTWSFRQSVVDQARASIHDMGGERVA